MFSDKYGKFDKPKWSFSLVFEITVDMSKIWSFDRGSDHDNIVDIVIIF